MSEAVSDRLAKFYPMEQMGDRDFVIYGITIIASTLQHVVDAWLPSCGGSSNYHVIEDPYWDFAANIRVVEAMKLLSETLVDDLSLLTQLGGIFLSMPDSKLAELPATRIVNRMKVLETLDAVAAEGDATKLHIRVLRLNLKTTRDRYRSALRILDRNLVDIAENGGVSAFSRFNVASKIVPETLSEVDKGYRSALSAYESALQSAIELSRRTSDRPSETSQIFWSSLLFTRLIGFGVSIARLLPGSSYVNSRTDKIWDNSAVSTLARAAFECFLLFFYMGVEQVPADEWSARQKLMFLHDATMRLRVFYATGENDDAKSFYTEQRETLLDELGVNAYFQSQTARRRDHLRKGRDLFFLTQDEILARMGWDQATVRRFYELLSAHVHSLPVAFYMAMHDGRGRGVETDAEKSYISQTLQFLVTLIGTATTLYEESSAPYLISEADTDAN